MKQGGVILLCAWILWSYASSGSLGTLWFPFDSYDSLSDCKQQADVIKKQPQQQTPQGKKVLFVCLPDTINPWGQAGGRQPVRD